jgi:hypothetical protein
MKNKIIQLISHGKKLQAFLKDKEKSKAVFYYYCYSTLHYKIQLMQ